MATSAQSVVGNKDEKKLKVRVVIKKSFVPESTASNTAPLPIATSSAAQNPSGPSVSGVKPPGSVLGYIRVSTKKQVKNNSLAVQEHLIREYAKNKGLTVKKIYCDPGISGVSMDNRPGLLEALEDIRAGDELVCAYTDRLARNYDDSMYIMDDVKSRGATLVCLDTIDNEGNDRMLKIFKLTMAMAMAK